MLLVFEDVERRRAVNCDCDCDCIAVPVDFRRLWAWDMECEVEVLIEEPRDRGWPQAGWRVRVGKVRFGERRGDMCCVDAWNVPVTCWEFSRSWVSFSMVKSMCGDSWMELRLTYAFSFGAMYSFWEAIGP